LTKQKCTGLCRTWKYTGVPLRASTCPLRLDGRATEFSTDGQHSIAGRDQKFRLFSSFLLSFFSLFAVKIGNKIDRGKKEREKERKEKLQALFSAWWEIG
jgi:hypothetical protein